MRSFEPAGQPTRQEIGNVKHEACCLQATARTRAIRARKEVSTAMYRIPCPECSRKLKTPSGLRWHLFHIHTWKNVDELLSEPSPARLANIAAWNEIELMVFSKASGLNVQYLKDLISEYFGTDGSQPTRSRTN